MCKFYVSTGSCSLGSGCRFAHGQDELRAADYRNPNRENSPLDFPSFLSPPDTPTSTAATDESLVSSVSLVPPPTPPAVAERQAPAEGGTGGEGGGGSLMQLWNSGRRLSAVAAELQKLFFPSTTSVQNFN